MTGKDMLSQEEIDALLKLDSSSEEVGPNYEAVSKYLSPLEVDALGEIGNIAFGSASTALSKLLRQKVDITTPEVDIVLPESLIDEFRIPFLAVHVNYTEGFEGTNLLVIQTEDAQIIADIMLGGDGLAPAELGEIQISACQEAMNQMMGSASTSMSTIFNKIVNISPPSIDILDLPGGDKLEHFPENDILVKISFRLKIGELVDSTIMQLIPVSFANVMVQMLTGEIDHMTSTKKEVSTMKTPKQMDNQGSQENNEQSSETVQKQSQQPSQAQINMGLGSQQSTPQFIGGQGVGSRERNVQGVEFSNFEKSETALPHGDRNLDLLLDIPLQVTVELGRTKKLIREILEFGPGSIIELDKLAGEPVDILVNNKLIAKGEVVVIEENFGVRVTDIVSQWERIQKLQ